MKQMMCVKPIIQHFCNMSGQHVSSEKSGILFSKNVSRGLKTKLVNISGHRKINGLGKYLGVPITSKALKNQDFDYVLEQISKKLSSWKARQISFAGRLT